MRDDLKVVICFCFIYIHVCVCVCACVYFKREIIQSLTDAAKNSERGRVVSSETVMNKLL